MKQPRGSFISQWQLTGCLMNSYFAPAQTNRSLFCSAGVDMASRDIWCLAIQSPVGGIRDPGRRLAWGRIIHNHDLSQYRPPRAILQHGNNARYVIFPQVSKFLRGVASTGEKCRRQRIVRAVSFYGGEQRRQPTFGKFAAIYQVQLLRAINKPS